VTSAKVGLDQAVLERAPKSGCIFAIDTETRGQGDHHFAG